MTHLGKTSLNASFKLQNIVKIEITGANGSLYGDENITFMKTVRLSDAQCSPKICKTQTFTTPRGPLFVLNPESWRPFGQ